jgi:hypothetical protein
MLAFALSLGVYFSLATIGYSITPSVLRNRDPVLTLFLSPALGLSATILFIFTLSRLGMPLRFAGMPLLFLLLASIGLTFFRRGNTRLNPETLTIFILTPLGILLTAWPILKYGFSWISYVNDDMNNYVLAAMRFYEGGFFNKPNSGLMSGKDYSQVYYYFHVTQGVRPGSELFLSALSTVKKGDAFAIFMPAIVSLQMILMSATVALSRTINRVSSRKSIIAYFLFLFLPLASLGFLYQLIGQIGGLAIAVAFIALAALAFRIEDFETSRVLFVLLGLLLTAQMIWYPEFLPFVAAPVGIKLLALRGRERRRLWLGAFSIAFLTLIALNKYFLQAIQFGIAQIIGAQTSASGIRTKFQVFPYFLKPHGLPAFFGISPLNKWLGEPWESISVIIAVTFFLALVGFVLRDRTWKQLPITTLLVILAGFVFLTVTHNGFGSFKIAMYAQPFLIVLLAIIGDRLFGLLARTKRLALLGILSISCAAFVLLGTGQFYASASTGEASNGFNEIPFGSKASIENQIHEALRRYVPGDGIVVSPAMNLSQVKLEAIASQGVPIIFPTNDIFINFFDQSKYPTSIIGRNEVPLTGPWIYNSFSQAHTVQVLSGQGQYYLLSNNNFETLNKSKRSPGDLPWKYSLTRNPVNLLIFIDSAKGHSYYNFRSYRDEDVIFQPEKNPMLPGTYMQSIGDHLLLQMVNPSKNAHFVMELSATVLPQYDRALPSASVVGSTNADLPLTGHGSARISVPLVEPVVVNGDKYIQLNINRILKPFPDLLSPMSKFYGASVNRDGRMISLFSSNISVVDSNSRDFQNAPTYIGSSPSDLENRALYYSGIYEDGWLSDDSYAWLRGGRNQNLVVKASIPRVGKSGDYTTEASILVDGQLIKKQVVGFGNFEIDVPSSGLPPMTSAAHKVEIQFSKTIRLPKPDGRPVSAQIQFFGFTK